MDEMPDGFRAARDERGYTTHVEDMNYADWKAIYVDRTKTLDQWRKEQAPAQPAASNKIPFTPAKTIEEAQEFAMRFVDSNGMGKFSAFKGTVNYKGISLDMANALNEALNTAFELLDLPKLGGIKVVSPTTAQGKKAFPDGENAMASYSPAGQGIFLNKNVLKDAKAFEAYCKRAEKAWRTVMDNIDHLEGNEKELAQRYKEAGRDLVWGDSVQGVLTHELGHHVQWQVLKANEFNDLIKRKSQYAGKISGYALASNGEYIAESFAAYMKGERDILDPEFVKLLNAKLKAPVGIAEETTVLDKSQRISALKKKINETHLADCSVEDVVSIGKEINSLFEVSKHLGDKGFLKETLGQFRELDGSKNVKFAKGSFAKNKGMLLEAFSCYPKAWAEYLVKSGRQLLTRKSKRGFFGPGALRADGYYDTSFENCRTGYVTIYMSGERATTPFHEIGHMVEFFNKDALRISRAFVEARTQGEAPVSLKDLFPSDDYRDDEMVKPDNFIDPYIGKDYGEDASEVLSMGLEQIFSPTKLAKRQIVKRRRGERTTRDDYELSSIEDDEEYLALILGLFLKA